MSVCATSCTLVLGAIHDWYLRFGGTPPYLYSATPYTSKFTQKIKNELLSSAQNERLCDFLHTRFESHLRLVSAIWGDPPPHDIALHPIFQPTPSPC